MSWARGTFGERVGGEQHAELTDQAGSLAEGQVGLDPVASTLERSSVSRAAVARRSPIRRRRPAAGPPGEQRVPQDPRGLPRVAVGQRAAALRGQFLEGHHVDRTRRHGQAVSGGVRFDHVARASLAQFGPQPGNQRLQGVAGVAGRIVGPEFPGQRAPGRHARRSARAK
jgi:hypothetical protein